ncbi:MAG: polysaccharide deacetylase family protein [Pseudohaliea sp.]
MIRIEAPVGCREERAYVAEVLFGDWLGVPYTLAQRPRRELSIRLDGQPGELLLPDSFFSQFILSPKAWLGRGSLPVLRDGEQLPCWDSRELVPDALLTDPILPVLFGDEGMAQAPAPGGHGVSAPSMALPIDILGTAFVLLSRYEEAVLSERDNHERFPATASLAYRAGFLHRPLVDEYVEVLWAALQRLWPGLTRRPLESRTLVSCDVDSPFAFDGDGRWIARRIGGDLLKRRSPALARRSMRAWWNARGGDYSLDPHRLGLDYIMEVNERAGRRVAFYFIAANTDLRLDTHTSLDDPRMRALLREIHLRGHEIGCHPGYNTFRHPEAMAYSVATLRRVLREEGIEQPVLGARQHFLRWETPRTARLLEDNGVAYDSTLSYADCPGFRCGTCREYGFYDVGTRRPLRLRERPLIVMECSVIADRYLGLGYSEDARREIERYKAACSKVRGDFTLLWHNSQFEHPSSADLYSRLLGTPGTQ